MHPCPMQPLSFAAGLTGRMRIMSIRYPVNGGSRDAEGRHDGHLTASRKNTGNADHHCVPPVLSQDCRPRMHARFVRFDYRIILGESERDIKRPALRQRGNAASCSCVALAQCGGKSNRRYLPHSDAAEVVRTRDFPQWHRDLRKARARPAASGLQCSVLARIHFSHTRYISRI